MQPAVCAFPAHSSATAGNCEATISAPVIASTGERPTATMRNKAGLDFL